MHFNFSDNNEHFVRYMGGGRWLAADKPRAGKWLRRNLGFKAFKKPFKCPNLGYFIFLVQFYTNRVKCLNYFNRDLLVLLY